MAGTPDREDGEQDDRQNWDCGPFGFWPLTFPWSDGASLARPA